MYNPIIDRFEGDRAVIEYGAKTFHLPRSLIPSTAKEGDVLRFEVRVDTDTTSRRKREMLRRLEDGLSR